jgi:hypothetical protein
MVLEDPLTGLPVPLPRPDPQLCVSATAPARNGTVSGVALPAPVVEAGP